MISEPLSFSVAELRRPLSPWKETRNEEGMNSEFIHKMRFITCLHVSIDIIKVAGPGKIHNLKEYLFIYVFNLLLQTAYIDFF